ncbi:MAG: phosphatase PAP2 family protein [Gemmatimonadota bacterium]
MPTKLRRHPRWQLAIDLGAGYAASWLFGVGFGYALKQTSSWTLGAAWERAVLVWFHEHPLPWLLDQLMLATPYVGTNLTVLPLMIVVGLLLWRKFNQPLIAIQLLLVSLGSLSLNPLMKTLLGRPRPALFPLRGMWTWASYPSGHVILTPALYFTLSLMIDRWLGWKWPYVLTVLIILTTAYSRLYLSVHWPTDLIGGLLIGFTWLFGSWRAFSIYRAATHTHDVPQRELPARAKG